MENFDNKVAIVTGGSRGIGFATAKLLSEKGANVIITSKNSLKLKEAASTLQNVIAIPSDIKYQEQVNQVVQKTIQQFGKIDILVNNAGIFPSMKLLHEITESEWKEFRRLLIGRMDHRKRSKGLLDINLVVKDMTVHKKRPYTRYRLSLHGILYCIDVLDLTDKEIDIIATKYSKVLPKVFGKWDYLKSVIHDDVYKLRILSKGLTVDNVQIAGSNVPLYELMSFITIKYKKNFESISEQELANQISYWFYTNLLYSPDFRYSKKKETAGTRKLKIIFEGERELKKWYFDFFQEAKKFYNTRTQILNESTIF